MPRMSREKSPTGIKLIETLARYSRISGYRLFAYCLMDNHIHVLLQEHTEPLSSSIKRISSSYVFWFNKKHGRCGHLFQERFKSEVVDTNRYFLTVLRYIHQNPVKAKIVRDLVEYQWSSYSEYVGQARIIDKEYVFGMFSDSPDEALVRFRIFSQENSTEECLEVEESKLNLSDERLKEIMRDQFGVEAIEIGKEEKAKQESILRELKRLEGVSIRQIERTTGVSRARIWRA
jgi:putative transposase